MPILEKARKWMEKYTGLEPEKEKEKSPTAASTRKKQGEGFWQGDIGMVRTTGGIEKPRIVDGKGTNSPAKPL